MCGSVEISQRWSISHDVPILQPRSHRITDEHEKGAQSGSGAGFGVRVVAPGDVKHCLLGLGVSDLIAMARALGEPMWRSCDGVRHGAPFFRRLVLYARDLGLRQNGELKIF